MILRVMQVDLFPLKLEDMNSPCVLWVELLDIAIDFCIVLLFSDNIAVWKKSDSSFANSERQIKTIYIKGFYRFCDSLLKISGEIVQLAVWAIYSKWAYRCHNIHLFCKTRDHNILPEFAFKSLEWLFPNSERQINRICKWHYIFFTQQKYYCSRWKFFYSPAISLFYHFHQSFVLQFKPCVLEIQ